MGDAERDWFRAHIRGKQLPDDIPEAALSAAQLAEDPGWASIMVGLGLMKSKGEVRRLMKGGGFRVEGEQVREPMAAHDGRDEILVQYGKRRYVKIRLG